MVIPQLALHAAAVADVGRRLLWCSDDFGIDHDYLGRGFAHPIASRAFHDVPLATRMPPLASLVVQRKSAPIALPTFFDRRKGELDPCLGAVVLAAAAARAPPLTLDAGFAANIAGLS